MYCYLQLIKIHLLLTQIQIKKYKIKKTQNYSFQLQYNYKDQFKLLTKKREFNINRMNCVLHKSYKLQYFCQTCLDPICQQCVRSNPHSDQFHKIQPIQQAVQNRKKRFQLYVINEINPLRQRIRQKLQQLKQRESYQISYRNSILKDIVLEFQAIQQRTKSKTQTKISVFQTQIKYYQAYLNSIDDLAYTFDKTSQDPYNFLILYKDLNNQLKSLQLTVVDQKIKGYEIKQDESKIQRQKISQTLLLNIKQENSGHQQHQAPIYSQQILKEYEIPRQIKATYSILSTLDQLKFRNQFMNGLIATASQNYKQQSKQQNSNKVSKQKNALGLFNKINQNILLLNSCKTCIYCELPLNLQTLNEQCQQNKSIKIQQSKNYSHIKIEPDFKGTRRHYWADSTAINRKIPDLNAHALVKLNMKKQFLNSLKDLSIVKCYFKRFQIQNKKEYIQPFTNADKQKKGNLSKIAFKYILTKVFQIKDIHCDLLTQLLSIKWKTVKKQINQAQQSHLANDVPDKIQPTDYVDYTLIQEFIENPLFAYEQFLKIEDEIQKTKPVAPKSMQIKRYKF